MDGIEVVTMLEVEVQIEEGRGEVGACPPFEGTLLGRCGLCCSQHANAGFFSKSSGITSP